MGLAAVDDIGDALSATREFLLPFDAGQWLRLAVIAFFVGGAGGSYGGGGGGGGGTGGGSMTGPSEFPDILLTDPAVAAALGLVAFVLLLGLVFAVIAAVMEFVLVESLRREQVRLRRYWAEHWRSGLRLFGFRLAVGLLAVVAVALILGGAFFAAGGQAAIEAPLRFLPVALIALPLVALVGIGAAVGLGFTTEFVVPVMLVEGTGVLEGWRRFWPTLRGEWREYAVYVLLAFVLRLLVSFAVGLVFAVLAAIVLLPLGTLGLATYLAGGGQFGLAVVAVLGGIGVVALVALAAIGALLGVPVVTYFRYYALLLLGDTAPEFDLIPDRRGAIRDADPG